MCCISFDSYIKPQPERNIIDVATVVYLLIPTSNHNSSQGMMMSRALYIFWFLHQTTTSVAIPNCLSGCISFDSYIKPQHRYLKGHNFLVVYLLIPTSNHNPAAVLPFRVGVVYLLIPTSNHNSFSFSVCAHLLYIFWFLHQTTTVDVAAVVAVALYIFWFLHQTTTYDTYIN